MKKGQKLTKAEIEINRLAREEAKPKLIVKLNSDYSIWVDYRQYILYTPNRRHFYFSNITALVSSLFGEKLKSNLMQEKELKNFVSAVKKTEKHIMDFSAKLEKVQRLSIRKQD